MNQEREILSDKDLDKALDEPLDEALDELEKTQERQKKLLKIATNNFLDLCGRENITIETVNQKIRQKNLDSIQRLYRAAFQFDKALTIFTSQGKIAKEVHFVIDSNTSNAKTKQIIKIPYDQFYLIITKDLKISLPKGLSTLKEEMEKLEKETKKKKVLKKLQKMANEIQTEMEKNTKEYTKGDKTWIQIKQNQLFSYTNDKGQKIVHSLLNRGDLNEAYAAARYDILQKRISIKSVNYEWFFQNYISKIDNTPAVIEEDIERKGVSIAVKSVGAAAPGLKQYMQAAQIVKSQIEKEKKEIKSSKLKEEIKNEVLKGKKISPRNKIVEEVDKKIDQLISDLT